MAQGPLDPKQGIQPNQAPDRAAGAKGRRAARAGQAAAAQAGKAARGPQGGPPEAASSPAFHVLLDKLQRSARELQENADAVERPSDLAGAVGRAKASLDDALQLGDRLLEAWRAERLNTTPDETDR